MLYHVFNLKGKHLRGHFQSHSFLTPPPPLISLGNGTQLQHNINTIDKKYNVKCANNFMYQKSQRLDVRNRRGQDCKKESRRHLANIRLLGKIKNGKIFDGIAIAVSSFICQTIY